MRSHNAGQTSAWLVTFSDNGVVTRRKEPFLRTANMVGTKNGQMVFRFYPTNSEGKKETHVSLSSLSVGKIKHLLAEGPTVDATSCF